MVRKKEEKKAQLDRYDRLEQIGSMLWIKFQAACWIGASVFIIYKSNFFKQLYDNPNVNQLFLTLFLLSIGINCSIAIYAAVILPYFLRVREDIETYNPRAIQIGAFSGFLSFLSLLIAVWPVWGWLSFPMIFAMFLGFLNTGHFLPNHTISGIIFGGIFVGAFFSHLFIEHEGHWH